jgi:NAD(P)H dehydrogenase (quinone)
MQVLIVCYSMYGHIHQMAQAVAEGVNQIDGAQAVLRRVPETLPTDVLAKMGAADSQKAMSHVPVCKVGSVFASSNTQHG